MTAEPALSTVLDEVHWLPGAPELLDVVRAELPQRRQLCGAFTGLAALRALADVGSTVDQEAVAVAAGTVLSARSQPSGETYRLALPTTSDPRGSGTPAAGVRDAVVALSGGRLAVVPASGQWHADTVPALLGALRAFSALAVIANVFTAEFATHHATAAQLRAYLATGRQPEPSSRRSGHFVLLGGTLTGPAGTLVAVLDTYASLGDGGVHLQPAERLAAALRRAGRAPGGLLLVVSEQDAAAAGTVVREAGLSTRIWDNGTPYARG